MGEQSMKRKTMFESAVFFAVLGTISPAEKPGVPAEFEGLRERWESAMSSFDVPGLAVVVVKDDKVIYTETIGVRDPASGKPVTPDTYFYIASCTKAYLAMAMMTLVEEGKLSLDDPVKKYLPRFQTADPKITESLTIRDLLSHAKGLSSNPIVSLDAFSGEITEERFYHWLKSAKAKGDFAYSNLHYTLAGRIIEAVTGKPWKDYLEERIFKPAGMKRTTGYASRMYKDPNCAVPCDLAQGKMSAARVRKTDRTMHAAGGMGSTVADLSRWLRLNLNRGTIDRKSIISRGSAEEMQRIQAKMNPPATRGPRTREGYGLGWNIGPYDKVVMLEHGGGYVGSSAQIAFIPEKNIGVAAVANANRPIADLAVMDVCDRLLGVQSEDLLPQMKEQAEQRRQRAEAREKSLLGSPVDASVLTLPPKAYVGEYESVEWGTAKIILEDDRLAGRWGDLAIRLARNGENQFLADSGSGDPDKGRFELSADKVTAVVILVDEDSNLEARFTRK